MWWWRDASGGEERGEERSMRKDRSVSSRGARRERGASTSLLPMDLIGRILSHVADVWMWWALRLLAGSGEWSHTTIPSDCASGERIGGGRAIERCQDVNRRSRSWYHANSDAHVKFLTVVRRFSWWETQVFSSDCDYMAAAFSWVAIFLTFKMEIKRSALEKMGEVLELVGLVLEDMDFYAHKRSGR